MRRGEVVDLGSAPGSWSQVARASWRAGRDRGRRIIALDILPMEPVAGWNSSRATSARTKS